MAGTQQRGDARGRGGHRSGSEPELQDPATRGRLGRHLAGGDRPPTGQRRRRRLGGQGVRTTVRGPLGHACFAGRLGWVRNCGCGVGSGYLGAGGDRGVEEPVKGVVNFGGSGRAVGGIFGEES